MSQALAQSGDQTAAVITELHVSHGRVEVSRAGTLKWQAARPLQALRAGDALRATEDAWTIATLARGGGSVRVDAARSPYQVPLRTETVGRLQKWWVLLDITLSSLAGRASEGRETVLGSRGQSLAPMIVSPRNSFVLSRVLAFEFVGGKGMRISIRTTDPDSGVLVTRDVTGSRFEYSFETRPPASGRRFVVRLSAGQFLLDEAWFEIVDSRRAEQVQTDLADIEAALATAPPSSTAAVKAGYLANGGFLSEARLVVIAALRADPSEPTLHYLLGTLYREMGLPELASDEYEHTRRLSLPGSK